MMLTEFETVSTKMCRNLLVTFQAPAEDVDRIMQDVTQLAPLVMGNYDCNAFQTASGLERYRPLAGAAAGAETHLRQRPGVVEVLFELPDDRPLLEQVVEAIFQGHSYEEPVIRVQPVLSCRSRGLDDKSNPNRWWNRGGDWIRS